jgi:hypothetical protein
MVTVVATAAATEAGEDHSYTTERRRPAAAGGAISSVDLACRLSADGGETPPLRARQLLKILNIRPSVFCSTPPEGVVRLM